MNKYFEGVLVIIITFMVLVGLVYLNGGFNNTVSTTVSTTTINWTSSMGTETCFIGHSSTGNDSVVTIVVPLCVEATT